MDRWIVMSSTQWAVLAAAAVLVFWMVGAYNRLVALRNAIGAAWTQIDAALHHRGEAVEPLLAALRDPLTAEQGAMDAWLAAHRQAGAAAATLGARPVALAAAAAWVAAETALASAASRVFALLEQQVQVSQRSDVAGLVARWHEGQSRLGFARQLFDSAAADYNAAAVQLPTRWLLRVFGFGRAGLLGP